MDSDGSPPSNAAIPRIREATYLVVLWVCIAVSCVFITARLGIGYKINRRWKIEDGLVFAAWLFSLGNTIAWTVVHQQLYLVDAIIGGKITTIPSNIGWVEERFLRAQLTGYLLSFLSLWSVKFSFLFFFRKLGEKYQLQRILWWIVFALLIATFGGCLSVLDWQCQLSNIETIENCSNALSVWYERASLRVSTSMDIVSDAAIIFLSGNVLWRVHINWLKKLALIGISLLTAFIITVALIRIETGILGSRMLDLVWLQLWSGVETCVAILVACLASFRTLYTISQRSRNAPTLLQNVSQESGRGRLPSEGSIHHSDWESSNVER